MCDNKLSIPPAQIVTPQLVGQVTRTRNFIPETLWRTKKETVVLIKSCNFSSWNLIIFVANYIVGRSHPCKFDSIIQGLVSTWLPFLCSNKEWHNLEFLFFFTSFAELKALLHCKEDTTTDRLLSLKQRNRHHMRRMFTTSLRSLAKISMAVRVHSSPPFKTVWWREAGCILPPL